MAKEKISRKLYRKIIKADFKLNENVQSSAFRGVQYIKPTDYLNGGRVMRFFERLWYFFVFLMFGFVVIVFALASGEIYEKLSEMNGATGLITGIALIGIWVFGLYMALISQAYLRWMHKNRNISTKHKY